MLSKIYSAAVYGVEALEVEIEVNAARTGDVSAIVIVGLPDTAVKESKDRVITAIANSGYRWPRTRTTINLAPADIRKEGPSFDLPIALGLIACGSDIPVPPLDDCCFVGELALTGAVRPVKGILPIAIEARNTGKRRLFVPTANAREAAVVEGIDVFGVNNLREVFEFVVGDSGMKPVLENVHTLFAAHESYEADFADVKGQHNAKRAIEVASAGGHNLLMIGPPGSGKSMLSKRIVSILPSMTLDEAIETTKIHSICGLLDGKHAFVANRPFRSPHHTISDVGLLGGSTNPTPGEVSLAHNGVLFLDELPEFKRSTLEVLRQPLEDGHVTISRAAGSMTFPAGFMLVAAMNPCPCGYFGDPKRDCRCAPGQVERYRQRISGPLLDRIDIHIEVPAVEFKELTSRESAESSAAIRERVEKARSIQKKRFTGAKNTTCNARMTSRHIKANCQLGQDASELLQMAMSSLHLSARAYDRILKVSRTIADLAASNSITVEHLGEAIQYRTLDRSLWT
ncbi:MAG TPA: YifB family Mg chelatase-like AAA ATPase [Chthoniobacterales bacterium]